MCRADAEVILIGAFKRHADKGTQLAQLLIVYYTGKHLALVAVVGLIYPGAIIIFRNAVPVPKVSRHKIGIRLGVAAALSKGFRKAACRAAVVGGEHVACFGRIGDGHILIGKFHRYQLAIHAERERIAYCIRYHARRFIIGNAFRLVAAESKHAGAVAIEQYIAALRHIALHQIAIGERLAGNGHAVYGIVAVEAACRRAHAAVAGALHGRYALLGKVHNGFAVPYVHYAVLDGAFHGLLHAKERYSALEVIAVHGVLEVKLKPDVVYALAAFFKLYIAFAVRLVEACAVIIAFLVAYVFARHVRTFIL